MRRLQNSLDTCSKRTGLTVERSAVPYSDLVQKLLLAASSNSLPDIAYIDNSDVAQLAAGGFLTPVADARAQARGLRAGTRRTRQL